MESARPYVAVEAFEFVATVDGTGADDVARQLGGSLTRLDAELLGGEQLDLGAVAVVDAVADVVCEGIELSESGFQQHLGLGHVVWVTGLCATV